MTETNEQKITKEMPIGDVVRKHPETVPVFMKHGLHCIGCAVAAFESIAEGAAAHGIDVEALVTDLNQAAAGDAA
jgi:hybrid cluster-associated redox disulfide protein